jgi:Ca2+-binding EF-hand superfamily protein
MKEKDSMEFFHPWFFNKNYKEMGNERYKHKLNELKKIIEPIKDIVTQKELAEEMPNPKYFETAKFYKNHGISKKPKTFYTSDRVANLEESFKGKEIFAGDSMMIADTTKLRKNKKQLIGEIKTRKEKEKEALVLEKNKKNKEAEQETQLVKIEAQDTLEGKVDISKISEIRLALRRRYASRTNFRKIFKDWDMFGTGQINVYEAHKMINNLGIPINFNETIALIASSNKRGTSALNMEEFMHLIFNDNNALNLNLSEIKCKRFS